MWSRWYSVRRCERSLNPDKRSQLGTHYTSAADILLIVEPVVMALCKRAGLR